MASDDRGRRRGEDRRPSRSRSRGRRSRSRDRRRATSRSRSRDRHSRGRSRSRERRERRSRSRERRERRSRSRDRPRYRSRSHERRYGGSDRSHRPGASPTRWQHDRYRGTFTRGGRINEDVPAGLVVQPSARLGHYANALLAGFDDDLEGGWYGYGFGGEHDEAAPCATLRVSGLPEDAREADLAALFEPVGGVRQIRLPLERDSQQCKGFAFLEFESADAAAALMGSDWREQTFFGQHRLRFEYARPRQDPSHADWVCELCQAVNFGRRSECYQCQRARTPGARPVLCPADEPPSCILRVAGLQPATDEEALRFAFVPHAPVRDIRLVRDRHTGELRGVAYVQFYSIEDAGKALAACQDRRLDSQPDHPLRVSYARDRFAGDPHYQQYLAQQQAAPEAAAEAALAWSGWQPKEFGGGGEGAAAEDDDPLAAWERQQAAEAAGTAEASAPEEGELQRQPGDAAELAAAAAAAAGEHYDPLAAASELQGRQQGGAEGAAGLAQQRAAAEAAGFVFDAASGYMRDPASGYYYDANTGLYCHPTLQQWGTYDFASGQFVPHDAAAGAAVTAAAAAPGFSGAADSALALGGAALHAAKQAGPAARQQQAAGWEAAQQWQQHSGGEAASGSYEAPAGPAQRPRRGAVIGASAQLDPQGLLVAAQAAEEKAQQLRKQQEMAEAKRRRAEARRQQQQQQQKLPDSKSNGAAAGAAAPAGGGQPAAGGGVVHGVIHESSWAAARRAQQQQQGRQ